MLVEPECDHSDLKLLERKSRYYIPSKIFLSTIKIKSLLGKQKVELEL